MSTQNIKTTSGQGSLAQIQKKRWIAMLVLSTIVLACASALIPLFSNTITSFSEMGKAPSVGEIMKKMIPTYIFLFGLIGVGIATIVKHFQTGTKAKVYTTFGPNLLTMLFCIITASAALIVVLVFGGIIVAKIVDVIGMMENISQQTADELIAKLKEIGNLGKGQYIAVVVISALQVVFAILSLALKKRK